MPDSVPLILAEATLALYPADREGNPVTSAPVWIGARVENLQARALFSEVESTPSGATYPQFEPLTEQHEIRIGRIWVVNAAAQDYALARGRFVLVISWQHRGYGLTYTRTYYGVRPQRVELESLGVMHFATDQYFRAEYYVSSASSPVSPTPAPGHSVPCLFTREGSLVVGEYLSGAYRFDTAMTLTWARGIGLASQVDPTVLTLEVNGVLTATTLTLPAGAANEEVAVSITPGVTVPANQILRWKVTSAPATGAAWSTAVTALLEEP